MFAVLSFIYAQNAYAVTVYPGIHISNPITNYTADKSPNFNVTSITTTPTHIFLGSSYYDLSRTGSIVKANVTGFFENQNASFNITNQTTFAVTMKILGHIQQVKIDGTFYPAGGVWSYNTVSNETTISLGHHALLFVNWNSGTVSTKGLFLSGSIFGATAYFNPLTIFINSPATVQVTEVGLFNANGLLYDHIFSSPITVTAGSNFTIPYKFNDTNTGLQTYTAEAVVQSGANFTIAVSNQVTLYFGSFTPGQLTLNYTNGITAPFKFVRTNINSTASNLDVFYPSTFNTTCNLNFNTAQTNKTYSSLPASHATFSFIGTNNEVVNVNCLNANGNETGTYVLTQSQTDFPLLQQIKNFRSGSMGTFGMFGAFDMVTLLALILSIIGFNRVNESVGAVFNVALIGVFAYFGIIQWPVILSSSIALVLVLVISSTRKTPYG